MRLSGVSQGSRGDMGVCDDLCGGRGQSDRLIGYLTYT